MKKETIKVVGKAQITFGILIFLVCVGGIFVSNSYTSSELNKNYNRFNTTLQDNFNSNPSNETIFLSLSNSASQYFEIDQEIRDSDLILSRECGLGIILSLIIIGQGFSNLYKGEKK